MRKNLIITLVAAAALLTPAALQASGFGYYEHGAKATAMAGAFVGRADDVTTIFYNPAGIAFLEGTFINFSFHPVKPYTKSTLYGTSTEATTGWIPPASAFLSTNLSENITVGFGFFVPCGLSVDWPQNWIGREISYASSLRSLYFQPTIAFKLSEQFSVGIGFDYVRSEVEIGKVAVVPLMPGLAPEIDAAMEGSGTGYGFNVGALFRSPRFQIGVSYKSQISIDYEGEVDFTVPSTGIALFDAILGANFADQSISTTIEMPYIIVVGSMFRVTDNFNVQFDLQRTGWSCYDELAVSFENPALDFADVGNWNDIWTYRLGFEYVVNRELALRLGYIYDHTPIPDSTLKPILPGASRNELTGGFGYDTLDSCCWGRMIVDFALQYLWFEPRTSTFLPFPSEYDSHALIVGVSLTYRF